MIVQTLGFRELARALEDEPAIAEPEVREQLEAAAEEVAGEARRRLHTLSGKTKVVTRVQGSGPQLRALVKLKGRGAFWGQRGRRPGKRPPLGVIWRWVRRVGIVRGTFDTATRQRLGTIRATRDVRTSERDVAAMIARKIAREGTTGRPFLAPAVEAAMPRIRAILGEIPQRITRRIARKARAA